jgi:3-hydroxyanthranilate 3,4-dioxygenase
MVTIVGGPNSRTDYHVNQGAEFFYQIEGTMNLGVQENGEARTISISVGELYLLPAWHTACAARPTNTIGSIGDPHLRWPINAKIAPPRTPLPR